MPPVARDAATVVLLRDSGAGIEAFLMRRPMTMAFAPGMYVFPGGAVDFADTEIALDIGDQPVFAASLVVAAVRETFEECGVLLEPSGLTPWTHWVTPEVETRRFDTRFFAARLPEGQEARTVSAETDRSEWFTPERALQEHRAGRLPMLPPTRETLTDLREFDTTEAALASAGNRTIRPLLPRPIAGADGEVRWCLCDARDGSIVVPDYAVPMSSEVHGTRRTR